MKVEDVVLPSICLSLPCWGLFPNLLSPFSLQLERSFKFMREAEDQLKAIPQFCFPDAKDWTPVQQFTRYVLTSPFPTPEAQAKTREGVRTNATIRSYC